MLGPAALARGLPLLTAVVHRRRRRSHPGPRLPQKAGKEATGQLAQIAKKAGFGSGAEPWWGLLAAEACRRALAAALRLSSG